MIKKQFAGILAGNTAFFATQAIATQEMQPRKQATDQYLIIDLAAIEWETPEASLESEAKEMDVSETAQATDLNEASIFETKNQQDMIYQQDYAVKGICADEAIISYLLDGYGAYKDYIAINICEVTYMHATSRRKWLI